MTPCFLQYHPVSLERCVQSTEISNCQTIIIILVNAVIILILSAITVSLIVPSFSHTAIKYIQISECKSFESTFSFLLILLLKVVNCVSSISRGSGLNECKVENTKCNLIIIKSTAGARDMFFLC